MSDILICMGLPLEAPYWKVVNRSLSKISAPGGRPMQFSAYRSQNGARWGWKTPHRPPFCERYISRQTTTANRLLINQLEETQYLTNVSRI